MRQHHDRYGDVWLDDLEASIAGDVSTSEENEELLYVATRLASALAPLREIASARTPSTPQARQRWMRLPSQWRPSPGLLVAALLLLICIIGSLSMPGLEGLWNGAKQALHASISLDQINGVSIASMARPHAGLKPLPLLPMMLPSKTQASTYGVLTDTSDPNVMTTFVADYRINGQDMQLYEQPSDVVFLSTTAQKVQIGAREGQLFQDDAGNHALQWYQSNMLCQLTSKLSITLLIEIASVFQPIKSWDLLR